MDARLVQDGTVKVTIDANNKLDQIQPVVVGKCKEKDLSATEEEQTAYQLVVGKLQ